MVCVGEGGRVSVIVSLGAGVLVGCTGVKERRVVARTRFGLFVFKIIGVARSEDVSCARVQATMVLPITSNPAI